MFKRCVLRDRNMLSSMGLSIVVTTWLQQQIGGDLGDINQLQTRTLHNFEKIDWKLDFYKTF